MFPNYSLFQIFNYASKTPIKYYLYSVQLHMYIIMESTRQKKVARLVQKELGQYFQRESIFLSPGKIITVTVVRMSPDLSLARIYLSVFPSDNTDEILNTISNKSKVIRHDLGKNIRHQLRAVPELAFFLDDTLDYVDNIEDLLKQ